MRLTLDDARGAATLDSRDLIEVLDADLSSFEEGDFELACAILEIADCCEDWAYGAAFIRADTFEEYAEELADDIGAIDRDATWPTNYIDWSAAADALAQDYTSVSFLGHDYYVR